MYAANQDGNTVSVIDAASHQVTSTVQVGQKATGVAV
ncbi:hypothetical protein [Leifsonia xyli]|nr:hypothetical protein [Leifsonia xyli]